MRIDAAGEQQMLQAVAVAVPCTAPRPDKVAAVAQHEGSAAVERRGACVAGAMGAGCARAEWAGAELMAQIQE